MPTDISWNSATGEVTSTYRPWTVEEIIEQAKTARDYHWTKGALIPNGLRVQTDTESVSNLLGAIAYGQSYELRAGYIASGSQDDFQTWLDNGGAPLKGVYKIKWNLGGGQTVELGLSDLQLIGFAQGEHIQAVQERYALIRGLISNGEDLETVHNLIQTGWPS